MSWESWDRGQPEAPGHETAHSCTRQKTEINKTWCKWFWLSLYCTAGMSLCVSPLLVCEQCVCLQPRREKWVHWKTVVGTGSLKLSNLGKNFKFLKEKYIKEKSGKLQVLKIIKQGINDSTNVKTEDTRSHSYKTPLGGNTYPSTLLKVDESTLW